ncbi:MAG TPA: hypothetical protein VFY10_04545 [Dehalococcoidia bacterium]|nr:hypothetical protein [Dehalococcoidia bacterium]
MTYQVVLGDAGRSSWDVAEHWTKRFLDVLGGECDLRPLIDFGDGQA